MVGDQEAQVELDPTVRAVFSKSERTLVYVYCEILCISMSERTKYSCFWDFCIHVSRTLNKITLNFEFYSAPEAMSPFESFVIREEILAQYDSRLCYQRKILRFVR